MWQTSLAPSIDGGKRPASARPLSAPLVLPFAWMPPDASAGPFEQGQASLQSPSQTTEGAHK